MYDKYDYITLSINEYTRIWIYIKCLSCIHVHGVLKGF